MKKRVVSAIALLLAVSMFLPACKKQGDGEETTINEETKIEETTKEETTAEETTLITEPETEAETKAPETTVVTQPPVTTPPVTQPPVTQPPVQQGGSSSEVGGGGVSIGGIDGTDGSTTIIPGTQTNPGKPSTDTKVPEGYIKTLAGKLLVHTISDRSTNGKDDNSTNLSFMPMKDPNAKVNMAAEQNQSKVSLANLRPGAMYNGVLIGYDDYMFYKDTLYDFEGQGFLSTSIYDRTVQQLKDRNDWAESRGKKFYFVIAPNKNSIYSDYMPETYTLASYRRYDQFVELIEEAGITAVDLRDSLKAAVAANPKENLYYKYDTHWNNHAGYYAYRTTMDLIDEDFPNVVIHDRSEYQINYAETYMKDLGWYIGNYDRIKDYGPVYTLKSGKTAKLTAYVPKQGWGQFQFAYIAPDGYSDKLYHFTYTNEYNKNAPNIYIMRDSYSIAMVPFLKDSFYKSTYNWTFSFSESEVENADADIIMVIVAERNLRNYVNNKAVAD